tara:strand:+ start:192 stop:815 length:624 start_codon:yes stop_codon:yes gene_type:complete
MEKKEVIRSLYQDQFQILKAIVQLHIDGNTFEVDLTFGNGGFYKKGLPLPVHRLDIDDSLPNLTKVCNSTETGLKDASVQSIVFDPPFLTYIRKQRVGNSSMVMARRFSGYWRVEELIAHYQATIAEAARILKHKGIFVIKCQDIVHNHKLFSTHTEIIRWAESTFRLKDLFVQAATHRMPSPNRKGNQKHARIFHSFWLVFQRWAK